MFVLLERTHMYIYDDNMHVVILVQLASLHYMYVLHVSALHVYLCMIVCMYRVATFRFRLNSLCSQPISLCFSVHK